MRSSELRSLVMSIVERYSSENGFGCSMQWATEGRLRRTETHIAVVPICERTRHVRAFVKVALNTDANRNLRHHHDSVVALQSDDRLGTWSELAPAMLRVGDVAGHYFVIETALPGRPARHVPRSARSSLSSAAADAISDLHRRTAVPARVDDSLLDAWVRAPIAHLKQTRSDWRALDRMEARLVDRLADRMMEVCVVHGDYWLGNVLADAESSRVTGVIDWEWSATRDLAAHDLLHLALYERCLVERRPLGAVICERLSRRNWTDDELMLLDGRVTLDNRELETLLLLYWLRHYASNVAQSSGYAYRRVWTMRNIRPMLRLM